MAVKLRLTRLGAKKKPFYRIVAIDSHKARDAQYIEQIGIYNPVVNPKILKIDAEKAKKWIAQGAQPTDTVRALLVQEGVITPTNVEKKKSAVSKDAVKLASQVADSPEE